MHGPGTDCQRMYTSIWEKATSQSVYHVIWLLFPIESDFGWYLCVSGQLQCDETIKLSLITISRLDHARKVHSSVHQKCKSQSNSNPMLSKLLMLWHDRMRWQGFYQMMKFSVFFDSQINLLHAIIITNHIKVISRKFKPIR